MTITEFSRNREWIVCGNVDVPRRSSICPIGLEKELPMKFLTYMLSTIGLSLLISVVANPGAAMACGKILGTS